MTPGRILPGLLLAAVLGGCGRHVESPAPTFSVGAAGGTYRLVAVDAQPLPAVAYFGVDVATRATSGRLGLAADHTYSLTVSYTEHFASGNRDRTFAQDERGKWSAGDGGVQLAPETHSARSAVVTGDTLTVTLTVNGASPPERATKPYTFVLAR